MTDHPTTMCAKCLALAPRVETDDELRAAGWRSRARPSGTLLWYCPAPKCDPNAPIVIPRRRKRR